MAQTNYTPISLYYSTTASAVPTAANLVPGELAINTNDGKLYYEDSSGVVQVLATKSTGSIGGSTTQVQYNLSGSLAGSANLTFDGTSLTTPRLVLGGTTLPSAGTATLFSRTSDNNTYLQTGSGNNINFLDGSQNTMATFSPTALNFNISNTERMRLNSTGLGIGTSSPQATLQVTSSAFPVLKVADNLGGGAVALGDSTISSNYVGIWRGAANSISGGGFLNVQGDGIAFMSTNNVFGSATRTMTLDSSGNLMVGTTSTLDAVFSVVGRSGIAPCSLKVFTNGDYGYTFKNASGTLVGAIGVDVSTTTYNTTSDQRLKTNVVDAPSGNIDGIKVRSFDWIVDGNHQEYGMVAQELLEVAPYAVHQPKNPDEMMAVDYSKLVPMMIKEIQDLKQRIKTLENK